VLAWNRIKPTEKPGKVHTDNLAEKKERPFFKDLPVQGKVV